MTKGEFEELEAVSTMDIMDVSLEPPSLTVSSAADVPDDPAFVNFFSTVMTIGGASNAGVFGQPCQSSAVMPALSNPAIVASFTVPALQPPSPLSSFTPLPLLDTPESNSNHTNLVKPSAFFMPSSSSAQILPPVSTSLLTVPLLNLPLSLQCPYSAPLLQSFPPPTPSLSLTPAHVPTQNYGLTINREKVRDALWALVQDN
ncbi:hypothetical protein REPUB_Repub11eG0076500 [Reevesia pubescens]